MADAASPAAPEPEPTSAQLAKLEELLARMRGLLEPGLEAGERIEAVALGMLPRFMRTSTNVVGVTTQRLLIQPANPDWTPAGELLDYLPSEIEAFSSHGGRDNYRHKQLLAQSTTIELLPVDERKFRLVLMRGGGDQLGAHGARVQEEAITAIIDWLGARISV